MKKKSRWNKRWYVMDAIEKMPSWDAKNDIPEVFFSEKAAIKRAKEKAESEPHVGFDVCVSSHRVFVETKPVCVEKC